MRELKEHEVVFTVECLPENVPVRGNAMASGDEKYDRKCENRIIKQLNNGNQWAWCCVRVVAEWNGFVGEDYLGCCSYNSEEDFKECNDYYSDMKRVALINLNESIKQIDGGLQPLRESVK